MRHAIKRISTLVAWARSLLAPSPQSRSQPERADDGAAPTFGVTIPLDTGQWQLVAPLHEADGLDVLRPILGKLAIVYSNAAAPASATV
jgi:hypothetical protein